MSSPSPNKPNNDSSSQSNLTCGPNQRTLLSLKDRRKLKQRFRCTPWYNHDEFNHIGESFALATQLFTTPHPLPPSPSSSSKETCHCEYNEVGATVPNYCNEVTYAIQRVSIWRKRNVNSRLPHYIEITCSLAESLLQDAIYSVDHHKNNQCGNSSSTNGTPEIISPMTLRLSYASTIIRGVNGIADSMTRNRAMQISEQSNQSLSVSNLCSKMGLPSWIVDIRHDSSHQELPSLTMLRLGALTLLQFYLDKYWLCGSSANYNNGGIQSIVGSKSKGLQYLMQWKKSFSVSNNTCSTTVATEDINENNQCENKKADEDIKDNCKDDSGDNDSINFGKYSILMMESTSKKSRKKSNKEKTIIKKKDAKKKKKKPSITESSKNSTLISLSAELQQHESTEELMTSFLNDIPMDIAYDLLVSYFIWGGVGDAPTGRGILVPGSIKSFAQNLDGVRKLRQKYGQTLVQICKVWPGFIPCILVNIVDAILYLETEIDDTEVSGIQHDEDNEDGEGAIPNERLSGIGRKIYFLQSWAQYLVSNEFYYQLGWIDEATKFLIETSKKTKQSRKKKNNPTPWSNDQLEIVESKASLRVLKEANLPLNSLYDRVTGHSRSNNKSSAIVLLFESIIIDNSESCWDERIDSQKRKQNTSCKQKDSASKKQRQMSPQTFEDTNEAMMSLEEMESVVMTEDDKHTHEVSTREVKAWTKCTTWDPCVIGSLPGYIS